MSERQREFVEIILKSTDRLTELVSDLLDVARIEADRVEIIRRPIDVGEAVREIAELMGPRIAQKHQRLSVYVAPTLPLALADAARVRQIAANLLTNAHLYTDEGGSIQVRVEAERAWVQIVVAGHGVGMTPEQAERVFERFYRAREGGSTSPGTGLGLSIVKSLVELHDGQDRSRERARTRDHLPRAVAGGGAGAEDLARSLAAITRAPCAGRRRRARDRRADRRPARPARRPRRDRASAARRRCRCCELATSTRSRSTC